VESTQSVFVAKRRFLLQGFLLGIGVCFVVLLLWGFCRDIVGPLWFAHDIRHLNEEKERFLLYGVNRQALAAELRDFAARTRWNADRHSPEFDYFTTRDAVMPVELRGLGPTAIRIFDDRIEFDCGGPFLSFGIAAYKPGLSGKGTKQLGDGIWFYAEDNSVPPPK